MFCDVVWWFETALRWGREKGGSGEGMLLCYNMFFVALVRRVFGPRSRFPTVKRRIYSSRLGLVLTPLDILDPMRMDIISIFEFFGYSAHIGCNLEIRS